MPGFLFFLYFRSRPHKRRRTHEPLRSTCTWRSSPDLFSVRNRGSSDCGRDCPLIERIAVFVGPSSFLPAIELTGPRGVAAVPPAKKVIALRKRIMLMRISLI